MMLLHVIEWPLHDNQPVAFVCWMVKKYLNVGTAFKSNLWWTLKDRSYHNPKSTHHTINYNKSVHSCTFLENVFYYYYWQHSAEHYRVPSFHFLFSQLNTEINYICPSVRYMKLSKNINSLSLVVTQSFATPFFFVVSSICL